MRQVARGADAGDALEQLRARLRDRIRRRGLTQQAAADLAGISRTTVSGLLNRGAVTEDAVRRLAAALSMDVRPLLELLREAGESEPQDEGPTRGGPATVAGLGPALLEVHAALPPRSGEVCAPDGLAWLTPYLERAHDRELRAVAERVLAGGASVLVVLTGESSTGKARAQYEALRALAPPRPLLRPADTSDLLAMLEVNSPAGAVWWLNEAQRFLYGVDAERTARWSSTCPADRSCWPPIWKAPAGSSPIPSTP